MYFEKKILMTNNFLFEIQVLIKFHYQMLHLSQKVTVGTNYILTSSFNNVPPVIVNKLTGLVGVLMSDFTGHALQGKGCINTGLVRQAWGFPLFEPMQSGQILPPAISLV